MYRSPKKEETNAGEAQGVKECYATKVGKRLMVLGVIVIGAFVFGFVSSPDPGPVYSSVDISVPRGGQFQSIAFEKCPYCPGLVDSQGRCNFLECPIYSSNFGKSPPSNNIPVKKRQIKEMALEVIASQGKGSVVVFCVYAGGNGDKAGLKAGDRFWRFNGHKVKNIKQFQSVVTRARPESKIKIQVIRGEEKINMVIMLGEGEMEGAIIP